MMYNYNYNYSDDYLMHYGVKGMKWGVRKVRGHAGPGRYITRKRQLAGDKRDLKTLEKGGHLSVGLTKKRQATLDARDKAALEKRIAKNEKVLAEQESTKEKKGLSDKQKKALKVGVAVAGTALAAYGAMKAHDFIREKNRDIRIKEASDKCDRMLKKLDRMQINDLVKGSSGTEKWVKTAGRTPFQYNNNGKSVTVPREYRNPVSTLKSSQYKNIENKIIDKTMSEGFNKAKNDSFATAAKNVYGYYKNRKK